MQRQDTNKRAWRLRRWSWAMGVGAAGLALACWATISSMTLTTDGVDDASMSEARGVQPRARRDGPRVDLTRLGVVHGTQRRGRSSVATGFWGHDHGEPAPAVASTKVSRGDLELLSSALETKPTALPRAPGPVAASSVGSADPAGGASVTIGAVSRLLALARGGGPDAQPVALASGGSRGAQSPATATQPDAAAQFRPLPQSRVLQAL